MIGDLDRATRIASDLLQLLQSLPALLGADLSAFRRDLGALGAGRRSALKRGTFVASLGALFDEVVAAGFAPSDIGRAREAAESMADEAVAGVLFLPAAFVQFSLVAEARLWSAVSFTSRNDVDRVREQMSSAFDRAIDFAADAGASGVMRALIALGAALQRHLIASARPLPRMITYASPKPLPSLVLAHRLYGDASRHDELEAENAVVHPLFMPASGRALSA